MRHCAYWAEVRGVIALEVRWTGIGVRVYKVEYVRFGNVSRGCGIRCVVSESGS